MKFLKYLLPVISLLLIAGAATHSISVDSSGKVILHKRGGDTETLLSEGTESKITVNTSGNCGDGNICSGTFTPTTSSLGGSAACSSITPELGYWKRVGDIVTLHGQMITVGCGTDWNFQMDLSDGNGGTHANNFTIRGQAMGLGGRINVTPSGDNELRCFAQTASPRIICWGNNSTNGEELVYTINYQIQ